ncbi:hypothetical protein FHX74_001692 [Friedmanniella endophytica]|uniref:Uncharacterized protein n=1 Tax=Microlunatus kandeliicorticis TaxID=1759536 RepID=A0A7W3IRW0_9ACTN|nr:hypothetical protein [Microlunatus kandeliicorticis]MBA8794087.1 hypothetical protein [Microlunatus kandeliicorticis]
MSGRLGGLRPVGVLGLAWGAVLLSRGDQLFASLEGRLAVGIESDAITVLGLRHAGQGLVQLIAPRRFARLYTGIDLLHAASMVALAVRDPTRRRAAGVSAGVAALSAAASARSAGFGRR